MSFSLKRILGGVVLAVMLTGGTAAESPWGSAGWTRDGVSGGNLQFIADDNGLNFERARTRSSKGKAARVLADTIPQAILFWVVFGVVVYVVGAIVIAAFNKITAPSRERARKLKLEEAHARRKLAEKAAERDAKERERKAKERERQFKKEQREAARKDANRRQTLLSSNQELINRFTEIAERKVSIIDDYGDENWDALPDEIETCLFKIAQKNEIDYTKEVSWAWAQDCDWLREKLETLFRDYHEKRKLVPASSHNIEALSGVDFEAWIAKLLREKGFEVYGTPSSGDQGADLIANKDGKSLVIQAKRHKSTVGNKAVQEVIGALAYYGGDEAWVVTNSSFTPAAKALAQKSKVRLVDGRMLKEDAI